MAKKGNWYSQQKTNFVNAELEKGVSSRVAKNKWRHSTERADAEFAHFDKISDRVTPQESNFLDVDDIGF